MASFLMCLNFLCLFFVMREVFSPTGVCGGVWGFRLLFFGIFFVFEFFFFEWGFRFFFVSVLTVVVGFW